MDIFILKYVTCMADLQSLVQTPSFLVVGSNLQTPSFLVVGSNLQTPSFLVVGSNLQQFLVFSKNVVFSSLSQTYSPSRGLFHPPRKYFPIFHWLSTFSKQLLLPNKTFPETFNQCCGSGSGSGLFGSAGSGKIPDPDPLSTKSTMKFKFYRHIKLSKLQFRPNNFLSLILCVKRCLDLVRKSHTKIIILLNIENIST